MSTSIGGDSLARLDGYLTKKAQDAFGPDAQVLEFTHGNRKAQWVLRRSGRRKGEEVADIRLGETFKLAREAVQALVRAEHRKQREGKGERA